MKRSENDRIIILRWGYRLEIDPKDKHYKLFSFLGVPKDRQRMINKEYSNIYPLRDNKI